MEFQVNTNNVILAQINQVESGEYNVTECRFIFSSEYEGLTKIAVFTGANGDAYKITILNNKCEIPSELLTESQIVQIGVYAYEVQGTEFILRYSPMPTRFMIEKGSYVVNAVNMSRPTPTEVEQLQSQITHNANDIEDLQQTVSEHTTDISNIQSDINDIKAEQTEQNTNIQKNTDDIVNINQAIDTINTDITNIDSAIGNINEDIDNLEQDLTNYSLITETGSQINLNVNSTNYQITAILKDKNGNVIYTSNAIDLPIESMIVNARYDNTTKEIILTLQNGNTLRISVADLVSGLVSETQLQTILANYYNKTEVDNLLSNLAGRVSTNEEDIADIKEEQITQNTNIEELQTQVETLQEDLDNANSEIAELNTDITNMRKAMITVEGQGTDITLENTSENKLVDFELEGRTEQEQLSGKNLANYLESSIQVTDLIRGTIQITNNGFSYNITQNLGNGMGVLIPIDLKLGETYYFKCDLTNGTKVSNYHLQQTTDSNLYQNITNDSSFTCNDDFKFLRIYIANETQSGVNSGSISNIMINNGSTAENFEPYCGGIPAPNPIYEIPIKNVTGNSNVKIQNKNLFNLTIEDFQNGEVMGYGKKVYLTLKPNTYYTLSSNEAEGTINATNIWFNGVQSDGNGVFINHPRTTRTDENGKLFIAIRTAKITTILENYWIQLEEGSTATSYVPHQEQNYPFTFAEGQRGMQGTTLEDDGIHNKRKQIVLDGTETWTKSSTNNIVYADILDLTYKSKIKTINILCSHFLFGGVATTSTGAYNYGNNTFSINNSGSTDGRRYYFRDDSISTVEEWTNFLANQYSNGTPVTLEVEFIDDFEEIIPYNETQQAQYNAIKEAISYYEQTNISGSSDELSPIITASAVGDLNLILDTMQSKIDLLEG